MKLASMARAKKLRVCAVLGTRVRVSPVPVRSGSVSMARAKKLRVCAVLGTKALGSLVLVSNM